jgi:osmotically inducible protein OsmC
MAQRHAKAAWQGKLKDGTGSLELGSGAFQGKYSFQSRFESGDGTNPEELIGAAHAACFSMALAHGLEEAGYEPQEIETSANVSIEQVGEGFKITTISLETTGIVANIEKQTFLEHATKAKDTCPVSQALAGAEISLKATLQS